MQAMTLLPAISLQNSFLAARLHDPFDFLGLHEQAGAWIFRAFHPCASQCEIWTEQWTPLQRIHEDGLFFWHGTSAPQHPIRLRCLENSQWRELIDPYNLPPVISEHDIYLFQEGKLLQSHRVLGAHSRTHAGVQGVSFCVWAPNAERISVIGDFNRWDGRVHPMRVRGSSGLWELFIPGLAPNQLYKFEIRNRTSGEILIKTDPYGFSFEHRPGTAARITAQEFAWSDKDWMNERSTRDWLHAPMNVYEVHLGSWKKPTHGEFFNFREIAHELLTYVIEMGYTHLELMPITEHPLDESWGYQTTGYFGVSSRFGHPDDFRYFVNQCHLSGIGVLLDWVPGHFPKDSFALARFDGSALYEHEDPRLGEHQDWGTYIFNYGRREVRGFLISNAHYWFSEFHVDGLRVDAVASMLYLDYSRKDGEWLPNRHGGRENLDALDFLREVNVMVHEHFPGALTMAEESTSWPMVSRPVYLGGLGFSMKWNMGWMNDTLRYFARDPIHRHYHHQDLTFGQLYAYTENFVLPFSHDEVVHGKKSLLDKMPGDVWQKFANLRLLFLYQMTAPGKKLNFMGNEFGHGSEWRVKDGLDWWLLDIQWHQGVRLLCRDLNFLYRNKKPLNDLDFDSRGFYWIECNDSSHSILSFVRQDQSGNFLVMVLNFTPIPRHDFRLGVPRSGHYRELLNSDSVHYGGSNLGNGSGMASAPSSWNGQPHSLTVTLPPLGGIILELDS